MQAIGRTICLQAAGLDSQEVEGTLLLGSGLGEQVEGGVGFGSRGCYPVLDHRG